MSHDYALEYRPVAEVGESARAAFMRRTYTHLAGAILAFTALVAVLLNLPGIDDLMMKVFSAGRLGWIIVLVAFMGVSWLADRWAQSDTSKGMQYLGLGLYVVAEAAIFLPILWIANNSNLFAGQHIIAKAAILTLAMFAGLTVAVLVTGKDFSFLRTILCIAGFVALGLIVASMIFGFSLGLWFCVAMVVFASACILYQTSQIQYHYRTDQYVAAALGLFASVALLFWYILLIFMRSRD